jgi:hypothetical protein
MRIRHTRRAATVFAAAAVAAGVIGFNAGAANAADAAHWVSLTNTGHGVGLYNTQWLDQGKVGGTPDLSWGDGDGVYVYCWTTGNDIDNGGDVWYGVSAEQYSWGQLGNDGFVYAAYADGNATYDILATRPPHC